MQWFPAYHQIRFERNSNYLNSLWLGFVWHLISLPEILWCLVIRRSWRLLMSEPILPALGKIVVSVSLQIVMLILFPLIGLCGRLSSENITLQQQMARQFCRVLIKMMEEDAKSSQRGEAQ